MIKKQCLSRILPVYIVITGKTTRIREATEVLVSIQIGYHCRQ